MDKEKFATILIGLLVGAGLALAYFLSIKFLPMGKGTPKQEVITTKKPAEQEKASQFSLDRPDDNSSTVKKTVEVAGKARPGELVVIFANADEKVASAGADGAFSAEIKLEEGANEISATIFDTGGTPTTIKREVLMEVAP